MGVGHDILDSIAGALYRLCDTADDCYPKVIASSCLQEMRMARQLLPIRQARLPPAEFP
jgi:hypothetical protein